MNKHSTKYINDFEQISQLVEQARYRAFRKVNEELILLYFKVGGIVSVKIKEGTWGESIVDQLAQFINTRHPELKGFNRRGLYRMRRFYETYTSPDFVTPLVTQLNNTNNDLLIPDFCSEAETPARQNYNLKRDFASAAFYH